MVGGGARARNRLRGGRVVFKVVDLSGRESDTPSLGTVADGV